MTWFQRFIAKAVIKRIVGGLDKMPSMKGWRTIGVNVATFLVALLAWPELTKFVEPQYVVMGTGVVNIFLRYITSTPILKGEDK